MRGHPRAAVLSACLTLLLWCAGVTARPQRASTPPVPSLSPRANAVALLEQLQAHEAELAASRDVTHKAAEELVTICKGLSGLVDDALKLAGGGPGARPGSRGAIDQDAARKHILEMQMSYNLQYLQLQNRISQENRQFSMVSNIMKNKHDTAKNVINNIR
jgi:hypothetical protein